jgi:hypothetical protein
MLYTPPGDKKLQTQKKLNTKESDLLMMKYPGGWRVNKVWHSTEQFFFLD